jgi:hypothetical protein
MTRDGFCKRRKISWPVKPKLGECLPCGMGKPRNESLKFYKHD